MTISLEIVARDGLARRGRLHTAHGMVDTPAFMPVGTAATVKAMTPQSVGATGAQIVLGNTYHLMLRPGADRVAAHGGLRRFMGWNGPILTDSGGFQVLSLAGLRTLTEEGARFRSHIDGRYHMLSPEDAVEIQYKLGSTITMVLDECTPYPAAREQADQSMQRSMRWAARSKQAYSRRNGFGLFGIVQGSVFDDLRRHSAAMLVDTGFDGYAIGGLAVGEGQLEMLRILDVTVPELPAAQPRYLMGVGKPSDLVAAVQRGIDMFDCVLPTRSGRTAQAFTRRGPVNLRNARHADDREPLDPDCSCPACTEFSRAYLHHLVKAGEILASMLLTWHNLQYYQDLMREMRTSITVGRLGQFARAFADLQTAGDRPLTDRSDDRADEAADS